MFRLFIIKRKLEAIILFPFILLGRLIALWRRPEKEYEIFFFFPFYHVGGADKVHALVARALGNERCIIYFTRRSHNDLFYDRFAATGCTIRDISRYTDNKWLYFVNVIFRGILSAHINRQRQRPVIFNGQCNFGYKISPWIRNDIPQIELIHSFNSFSWIRVPFIPFIHRTVMISKVRIEDHLRQYRRLGVPVEYDKRIVYICNGITISPEPVHRDYNHPILRVLYAGRGTAEKRVHLIARMAEKMHNADPPVQFIFLGDVQQAIPQQLHPYCTFYPYESDEEKIRQLYDQSDVLMIVSDTEGFPMVVEEAMARGCIIIATPVGDLPVHVRTPDNGFLFSTVHNEEQIVEEGIRHLQQLQSQSTLRQQIAENNMAYARSHFSIELFDKLYRELVHSLKQDSFQSSQ